MGGVYRWKRKISLVWMRGGCGLMVSMSSIKQILRRCFPALLIMSLIFWSSSRPSTELPVFGAVDFIVKKSGHILGYGLLALTYWFALGIEGKWRWLVWFLAIIYAVTDEYHQSFVPGRYASVWDVAIFDNLGVLLALWWTKKYFKQRPSAEIADR